MLIKVNMEILEEKVHLWLENARFVKSKPGVYVLYDKKLQAIYIGASENLQTEFSKYLDTNFENDLRKQNTHSYQRMFVDNPNEKKEQLLADYHRDNGIMPICNS